MELIVVVPHQLDDEILNLRKKGTTYVVYLYSVAIMHRYPINYNGVSGQLSKCITHDTEVCENIAITRTQSANVHRD